MPVNKTKSGFHVSSTDREIRTPEGVVASGIYIETAMRSEITLHYAGDDAITEGHPGLRLPVDPAFLRALSRTLNQIAKAAEDRAAGR